MILEKGILKDVMHNALWTFSQALSFVLHCYSQQIQSQLSWPGIKQKIS